MKAEIYKIVRNRRFDASSYQDFEKVCWVWSEDRDARIVRENICTREQREVSVKELLKQLSKSPAPSPR